MFSTRTSRALMCCATTVKNILRQQVRQQSQCSATHTNARNLSLAANAWQQVALKEEPMPEHIIAWATAGQESLRIEFSDGSINEMPYSWLRNSCGCSMCMRTLTTKNSKGNHGMEVYPEIIQRHEYGVVVDWSDGHISKYPADWLRSAAFIPSYYTNIHTYAEAP